MQTQRLWTQSNSVSSYIYVQIEIRVQVHFEVARARQIPTFLVIRARVAHKPQNNTGKSTDTYEWKT